MIWPKKKSKEFASIIGIGVGLYKDYGPAQKLYVKKGYIPVGHGVTYENKEVKSGKM